VPDEQLSLLHLAHRFPYPPDKGDRIRTFHTLRTLSRSAAIHLTCLADEPVPDGAVKALERFCARVAVVPVSRWGRRLRAGLSLLRGRSATVGAFDVPALRRLVRTWAGDLRFDAVLASASSMVPYLQLPELRAIPAVVDLVDVDSQKWFDYAAASRAPACWLYQTEGQRLRTLEQALPARARGVVLTTPIEVRIYESFAGPGTARAVANGVDLDYFRPAPPSEELSCVFVGALDYRPNVDGIGWFCSEVWPTLVQRRPDARLYVVGRQPVEAVRRLGRLPGVKVVGTVPDVRPWVTRATVAVVPLRIARGVQNKILEALAMGRPVIASPLSLQGLTAKLGEHLLAAGSAEEWLNCLERLFDDAALRQQLGQAGRIFVEENHCWDCCLEPLRAMLFPDKEPADTRSKPRASASGHTGTAR
jgi:sugar transferase (PEP-CTERM/EpsH1 system associated)